MEQGKVISMLMPQVRRPDFGLEKGFEKYYAAGSPIITHILNSLHVVFPEGEKLFIRSVKAYSDQITDPQLKAAVKGFIGQETQHMAQHEKLWANLERMNVKVNEFNEWYRVNAYQTVEGTIQKIFGDETYHKLGLAVTCALEHYTSSLAEVAIDSEINIMQDFNPEMIKLLMWHAAEEIEHKSVCFNVMQQVDGSQLTKNAGMVIATWALLYYSAIGAVKFLIEDKDVKLTDLPGQLLKDAPRLTKAVVAMVPKILKYFAPDFHPDQVANEYLAEDYFRDNQKYFTKAAV